MLIVNDLFEFQDNNFNLILTEKYSNGKKIQLAVIYCFNDISVTKKLCSYIFTLVGYHRYHKRVSSDKNNQKLNFDRFNNISN